MVIPSRWLAGGKGLDEFRERMLADKRTAELVDYPELLATCFPASRFKAASATSFGIATIDGDCEVHHDCEDGQSSDRSRPLLG